MKAQTKEDLLKLVEAAVLEENGEFVIKDFQELSKKYANMAKHKDEAVASAVGLKEQLRLSVAKPDAPISEIVQKYSEQKQYVDKTEATLTQMQKQLEELQAKNTYHEKQEFSRRVSDKMWTLLEPKSDASVRALIPSFTGDIVEEEGKFYKPQSDGTKLPLDKYAETIQPLLKSKVSVPVDASKPVAAGTPVTGQPAQSTVLGQLQQILK